MGKEQEPLKKLGNAWRKMPAKNKGFIIGGASILIVAILALVFFVILPDNGTPADNNTVSGSTDGAQIKNKVELKPYTAYEYSTSVEREARSCSEGAKISSADIRSSSSKGLYLYISAYLTSNVIPQILIDGVNYDIDPDLVQDEWRGQQYNCDGEPTFYIAIVEIPISCSNEKLTLVSDGEKLHKAIKKSSDCNSSSQDSSSSSSSSNSSSNTSSNWKQWLKDYEAWVDKYVAFMKKYKANPNDTSLLSDYSKFASETSKWASEYSTMQGGISSSDLSEFTTTYTRILNKLNNAL
ncbi:hypothetical protein LJC07_06060 [Christensenellaceae bacterium OttesenSCG-928-L17]|nr:hypothetical protein [Christensenellaceae bacterium OttesenSCG-928-L17]